jgi:hypothetical protein
LIGVHCWPAEALRLCWGLAFLAWDRGVWSGGEGAAYALVQFGRKCHRFAEWRQTPYTGKIVFLLRKRLPPFHPLLVQGLVELIVDALERVLDRGTAPDGPGAPARRINAP